MSDEFADRSYGYTLYRLAAGSYDIDLDGRTIGCLVRSQAGWIAELLVEGGVLPPPFAQSEHGFPKFIDALK